MVKNLSTIERSKQVRLGRNQPDQQAENTIIVNASDHVIEAPQAGFYAAPIRVLGQSEALSNAVAYNQNTGELVDSGISVVPQNLQGVSEEGNTTTETLQLASFITSSNVSVANAELQHTLSVGSNLYVDDVTSNAILTVLGNVYIGGSLTTVGDITTVQTKNLDISDPVISLGKNNNDVNFPFDVGIVMNRPVIDLGPLGDQIENVAVIYDEQQDELRIGYTENDASDRFIDINENRSLEMNIFGNVAAFSYLGDGTTLTGVALETDMVSNVERIATLETDLTSNAGRVSTLEENLTSNASILTDAVNDLADNSSRITSLRTDVDSNSFRLSSLTTWHLSNVIRIADLESNLTDNSNRITDLSGLLASNATAITTLSSRLENNSFRISVNSSNIANLYITTDNLLTNLQSNSTRITALESLTTEHALQISNLETDTFSNTLRLSNTEANVSSLQITSSNNEANIATLFTYSTSNSARISALETDPVFQGVITGDGGAISNITLQHVSDYGNTVSNTIQFTGSNALVTSGRVGIMTDLPSNLYALDINGNAYANGIFVPNGTEITGYLNKLTGNTVIYGNLNVYGSTSYLKTENVFIKDPILGIGNNGSADTGVIVASQGTSNVAFGFNNTLEEYIMAFTEDGVQGVTLTPDETKMLNVHVFGTLYTQNNLGVANTNPVHLLDVGSNIFATESGNLNAIKVIASNEVVTPKVSATGVSLTLDARETVVTGNLVIEGDTTFVHSNDLVVEDTVVILGNNNSIASTDLGLHMIRPDANVLVVYKGSENELAIAHSVTHETPDVTKQMNVHVYGSTFVDTSVNVGSNTYLSDFEIIAPIYHGDGGLLSNLVTDLQSVSNNGAETDRTVTFSNITTGVLVDSNVVVISNVTAGVYYGDGQFLDNISNAATLTQTVQDLRADIDGNVAIINGSITSNVNTIYDEMASNAVAAYEAMATNTVTIYTQMETNAAAFYTQMETNAAAIYTQMATNAAAIYTQMASNADAIYTDVYTQMETNAVAFYTQMASNAAAIYADVYTEMETNAAAIYTQMETNAVAIYTQMATNAAAIYTQMASNADAIYTDVYTQMETNAAAIYTQMASNAAAIYTDVYTEMETNAVAFYTQMASNAATIYTDVYTQMEANAVEFYTQMASNASTIYSDVYGQMETNAVAFYTQMASNAAAIYTQMAANTVTIYTAMESNAATIYGQMETNAATIYTQMASNAVAAYEAMAANATTMYSALHANVQLLAPKLDPVFESNITVSNNLVVSDLTPSRVVVVGADNELVDYAGLTFASDTLTVDGDADISGNLTVRGTTTYLQTINSTVSDALMEVGAGNSVDTLDLGVIFSRPSTNVGIGFRGDEGEFMIGHTLSAPDQSHLAPDTGNALQLHVYGEVLSEGLDVHGSANTGSITTLDASVNGNLTVTSTDAAPELTLYNNSATPANADYVGELRFQGENSTGGSVVYSKITGKIGEVTQGSEDGIIEFAFQRNSTETIGGRWTSDALKLINDTGLEVAGDVAIDTDTLFVDVSEDKVGINTTTPGFDLDVRGDANVAVMNVYTIQGLQTLSFNSENTTVPPLQLTAGALNDGIGALRIDSVEPDIFLNDTNGGFSTVTFAAEGESYTAFGRNSSNNFYLTVRDPNYNSGNWRDDTLYANSATGDIHLGYKLAVNGASFTGSNVLEIGGSANATVYYGDGGLLSNVSVDPTLQDVSDYGNTTSNVIQFTNATDAFVTESSANVGVLINQLSNVVIDGLAANENLVYDGANWVNQENSVVNYVKVHNNTGAQIDRGQAVYIYNAWNTNVANVALARSDSSATMPAIGLVSENIINGEEGLAIAYGKVNNVDTSDFLDGETLYISNVTAGGLSNVKPYNTTPDLIQNIGICIKASNSGVVFVTGVGRANDIPNANVVASNTDLNYVYVNQNNNDMKKIAPGNLLTKLQTLSEVTSAGASTSDTVTLTNATTGLSVSSNVLIQGNCTADVFLGDGTSLDGVALETDLQSNVTRISTLETNLGSNATILSNVVADLSANVLIIESLQTDLEDNSARVTELERHFETFKRYNYSNSFIGTSSNIGLTFASNVFYAKIVAQLLYGQEDVNTLVLEVQGGKKTGGASSKDIKIGTQNKFGDTTYPWSTEVGTSPTVVVIEPEDLNQSYEYELSVEYVCSAPDGKLESISHDGTAVKNFSY